MNALSGFLDRASISSISDLASLCFDLKNWGHLFDVFLRRSENNKPKPMRQLLLSLVRVLQKNPHEEARHAQTEYAIRRSLAIVTSRTEKLSVKPALQALHYLLTKNLIGGSDILRVLAAINVQRNPGLSVTRRSFPCFEPVDLSMPSWISLGQEFVSDIFAWLCYPDIAAAVGKLVATFIKSLPTLHEKHQTSSAGGLPLWVTPLQQLLRDQPQTLETIGNHVLPELLSVDYGDTWEFLAMLPFERIGYDTTDDVTEAEIMLCLLSAGLAPNLEISNTSGKPYEPTFDIVLLSYGTIFDGRNRRSTTRFSLAQIGSTWPPRSFQQEYPYSGSLYPASIIFNYRSCVTR